MNLIDMLRAVQSQGMGLLEAVHRMPKTELTALGLAGSTAGRWLRLADVFFGPTRRRRAQADAVAAARDGELPLDALLVIDKHARSLLEGDQWALRAELCRLRGTVDEINRAAAARVRELNRAVDNAEARAHARRSLKGGKNTDARGCRTFTVTGPERVIAATLAAIEKAARRLRRDNPRLSYEQAMFDALLAGHGQPQEKLTPHVVIGLPDWATLLRDDGDESVFALTDGTTITGAELVSRLMDDFHLVGLYDPCTGPINLYGSRRQSNAKQSALLAAEAILCDWPGCTTAADQAQDHHIAAWRAGGHTNIRNLAKLCRKHNGDNDDDPNAPPRNGRVEREGGDVVHHGPDGVTRRNTHPIKNLSARALAARR